MCKKEQTITRNVLLGILIILVVNTFYLRGFELPILNISVSYTIPLLIVIFVLITLRYLYTLDNGVHISEPFLYLIALIIVLPISSTIYNIITGSPVQSLWFLIEYINNMLLLIVSIISYKYINIQRLYYLYYIFTFLISFIILIWLFVYVGEIRRLGAGGPGDLPVAANHLAHGLGVGLIPGLFYIFESDKRRYLNVSMVSTIMFTLFLTGGRSSMLGLTVSIMFMIFYYRSTVFKYVLYMGAFLVGLYSIAIQTGLEISGATWDRFTFDILYADLFRRLDRFSQTFDMIQNSIFSLLFGIGIENYRVVSYNPVWDPHNLWLSYVLYTGVPTAIIVVILFIFTFYRLVQIILINKINSTEAWLLFLTLTIVAIYSAFSGRMTRIFTIWMLLGFSIGLITDYETNRRREPAPID